MSAAVGGSTAALRFDAEGLVPVVAQDAASGDVLMVAFMNAEALAATLATGRVHYWSRSRGRIWRKGESSGHEQIVKHVFVNCDQNSLLVTVEQVGAVCHDGYPTCYYRRLEADGSLTTVRDRVFDPAAVYRAGTATAPDSPPTSVAAPTPAPPLAPAPAAPDVLIETSQTLYDAFAYLRDHDLAAVSNTSARLRAIPDGIRARVADELRELAGTLDGTHRHRDLDDDVLLEATQVVYWLVLSALRGFAAWGQVRPDLALRTFDPGLDAVASARLIRAEARRWALGTAPDEDHGARCHAAMAMVGQACHVAGVRPEDVIEADLAALRGKAYLAPFFAAIAPASPAALPRPGS